MTARAALNAVYAHLIDGATPEGRAELDEALRDPRARALDARAARIAHALEVAG